MSRSIRRLVRRTYAESDVELERFLSRRLPTASDAQDLAQETWLRMLRVERADRVRNPRALLYRIAANLVYEFYQKRREQADTTLVESTASDERPTEARALDRRRIAKLEKVTAELSPKCRAALVLARRDGMTYAEIGERLDVSVNMVKKYLRTAHAHCRKRMKHN